MMSTSSAWTAHKFGGTSVANADCYKRVASLLSTTSRHTRQGVVVSAMSGITDALLQSTRLAGKRDAGYQDYYEHKVVQRHRACIQELFGSPAEQQQQEGEGALQRGLEQAVGAQMDNVARLLRAIYLTSSASDYYEELIAGHGEIWSAQMLNAYLQSQGRRSEWMDARQVLCVEHTDQKTIAGQSPPINWDMSRTKLAAWFDNRKGRDFEMVVITGFVCSTVDGVITTLKRNGSDYSGSIFGALLNATTTTIWTDVDGVYSADPRKVPDALLIDAMSYTEATEFSFYGAKIIHPKTMLPAIDSHTPIWIRNTFNPSCPGTKIHSSVSATSRSSSRVNLPLLVSQKDDVIMGFCTIDNIALVVVGGPAIGTAAYSPLGMRDRLFNSLKDMNIPLVFASQSAPEHSIWFCVPMAFAETAKKRIETDCRDELAVGSIHSIQLFSGYSILTGVGDKISQTPGVAASFFTAMHRANVNVMGVAQNGERIICVIVEGQNTAVGLRALHNMFKIPDRSVAVGVVGTSFIGENFLRVLNKRKGLSAFDYTISGAINKDRMWLPKEAGLQFEDCSLASSQPSDLDKFAKHLLAAPTKQCVIVDCSGSPDVAKLYAQWQCMGIDVVSCNNFIEHGFSNELPPPRRGLNASSVAGHLLYDLALGAGVPLPKHLVHLSSVGDKVLAVEGVVSATWSYILNHLMPGGSVTGSQQQKGERLFSQLLKDCSDNYLLEKDPLHDICGHEAARSIALIAHFCGASKAASQSSNVQIEPLFPALACSASSASSTLEEVLALARSELDSVMAGLVKEGEAKKQVLRLVGRYDAQSDSCTVSFRWFPLSHPFARLRNTEKCYRIFSEDNPDGGVTIQAGNSDPLCLADALCSDVFWLSKLVHRKLLVR